jgi:diguanylate cyclase (GGDEF)-like protein/PAS domain S-box-containing protein
MQPCVALRNTTRQSVDRDHPWVDPGEFSLTLSIPQSRPIRRLIICGLLLVTVIGIGTAAMIGSFRERALVSSERELENAVLLLARHFDQQIEQLAIVETTLTERVLSDGMDSSGIFERQMSGREIHLLLKAKIEALPYVDGISLVGADGKLINFAYSWPVALVNLADRPYFKALKTNPQLTDVLSEPVLNRATGIWSTILARKLTTPDGQFLGIIAGSINLAKFESFFTSLSLGDGASIGLFHSDGTLLARLPHVEKMVGLNFASGPMHRLILSTSDHGTMRMASPVDHLDRIVAAQKLGHFPVTVIATTAISAALADWREQTHLLIGTAVLSVLVIAAVLSLITRQLSREHDLAGQRLALEKRRLDIAINNMPQGLLLYDAAGQIVVCNRRYLEMYGLSPDVVKPGCSFRELIAHRKETGSFKGDAEEYCLSVFSKVSEGKVTESVVETADGRSIQVVNQPLANGGWIATMEDITERKLSGERIAHLAHYDALTDLPNRVLFRAQLEHALKTLRRGEQLAVLYIDIDEFKNVNDTLGHTVGDDLLKALADRLRRCLRETDFAARIGGDEFAVIQTAIKQPADTLDLVSRIYTAIREPQKCGDHLLTANASIGIALAPDNGVNLDQLLINADLAMYGAKADGRQTYRFFEPAMDARVRARRALELDLRQAMTDGGLELYYQPIVDLRDNKIVGCEALLRWFHPKRGVVPPSAFIPVAEETGMINELGEWALRRACNEAASWPDEIKVAVNVSPVQFKSRTLALSVAAALAASGLKANQLELEITEAVLIRDDDAALITLHQLRKLGVQIALDDFGTGYSSLSYLRRFPFDKIKIDRCFITDIAKPNGSADIVQAIVNIATVRNMTTTAEGVETERQLETIRKLGCMQMQGYLFSPAIAAPELKQLLLSHRQKTCAAA